MRAPRTTLTLLAATLALAGCGGDDGVGGDDAVTDSTPEAGGTISVEAGDLYFDPETITAAAGTIEIELVNVGAVEHDFVIEEAGDEDVAHAEPGETATGSIDLEAGTYTFYCSVPGHRSAMEGTLEVS